MAKSSGKVNSTPVILKAALQLKLGALGNGGVVVNNMLTTLASWLTRTYLTK